MKERFVRSVVRGGSTWHFLAQHPAWRRHSGCHRCRPLSTGPTPQPHMQQSPWHCCHCRRQQQPQHGALSSLPLWLAALPPPAQVSLCPSSPLAARELHRVLVTRGCGPEELNVCSGEQQRVYSCTTQRRSFSRHILIQKDGQDRPISESPELKDEWCR